MRNVGLIGLQSHSVQAEPLQLHMPTSLGEIRVDLHPQQTPKCVAYFLRYARGGSYQQSLFHRVIPGFVVEPTLPMNTTTCRPADLPAGDQ